MSERTFELKPATRSKVPLWIALGGPSGGGKTLSALRLATGIVRVFGGKIGLIDTEADRAKHYAPQAGQKADPPRTFDFFHMSFGAPFGSMDYLAAIKHCAANGVTVAIVDSFSHEHESIGGVLEQFEEELERLSHGDQARAERVKMLAWKKPKMARRRMLNEMLQMPISVIGCFRAKEKLKLVRGQEPTHLGYMPITGDDMIFEFPTRCLLGPRSDGNPCWNTDEPGEREWTRLPGQFRHLFEKPRSLDEDIGEAMAVWAAGGLQNASPDVLAKLEKLGVAPSRALAFVGRSTAADMNSDDIAILISKGKAIRDKKLSVDEAFPAQEPGSSG